MKCECCGAPFEQRKGPGRPRQYCTDQCRVVMLRTVFQPAWYRREQRRRFGYSPPQGREL